MKAQIRVINPFKVKEANELYETMSMGNSYCTEWGIDANGNIYFHYLNGITDRFTRRGFIKKSREETNRF